MSLLYRCLWTDTTESDRTGVVDLARDCFSRWAMNDTSAPTLPDGEHIKDSKRISVRTLEVSSNYGVEGIARDIEFATDAGNSIWTVTMRVLATESTIFTWVDVDMETDNPTARIKVGRPRLVDDLLRLPGKPCLGVSNIVAGRVNVSEPEIPVLVELLRSSKRTVPFIVFSAPRGAKDDRWLVNVDRTATRAGGVATVLALSESATTAFREALGPLGVWDGAVRSYAPAPLENELDGWRHRYIVLSELNATGSRAVDRLVYAATQMSTRRRVPAEFRIFFGTPDTLTAAEVDSLNERWQFELDLASEERSEVEQELARANGHLDRLRRKLEETGAAGIFWDTLHNSGDSGSPPDTVQDVSEAVIAAQLHLADGLAIASSAPRNLEGLDSAPNAYAWGNTTWRGLRALNAYAQAKSKGFFGNFWSWCEKGEPLAWPATKKKLAMQESETVTNGKYSETRIFDIDPVAVEEGQVYMGAHLKISEGGGDLAPRVYFYDDSDGRTKKVHVGFIGPHYLVPNTKG